MKFKFKIKKEFTNKKEAIRNTFKDNEDIEIILACLVVMLIVLGFGGLLRLSDLEMVKALGDIIAIIGACFSFGLFLAALFITAMILESYYTNHYKGKGYYETNKMIVQSVNKVYSDTIKPQLESVEIKYSPLDNLDEQHTIYMNKTYKDLQINDIFTIKTEEVFYHDDLAKTLDFKTAKLKYKCKILNDSTKLSSNY